MTSLSGINSIGATFGSLTQSGGVAESLTLLEQGSALGATPDVSRLSGATISGPRSGVLTPNSLDGTQVGSPNGSQIRPQIKDQARVSTTASAVSQALRTEDVRHEKVASLQAAIANGSYQVPASEIADKILNGLER